MRFDDVALIAANTSRSKAYLQALAQHDLLPNCVLLMQEAGSDLLPGQSMVDKQAAVDNVPIFALPGWTFRPQEPLEMTLEQNRIAYQKVLSTDIHSDMIREVLLARPESVVIYSGFGGVILRDKILSIGKRFLHVHGGYLPDYKGSTTNYYSLIAENQCGASAIFLTSEIDGGPVIVRRKFPAPSDRTQLDYIYDSVIRARVLVETLQAYAQHGDWQFELERNSGGETYYIMHPVLRHIAILARQD